MCWFGACTAIRTAFTSGLIRWNRELLDINTTLKSLAFGTFRPDSTVGGSVAQGVVLLVRPWHAPALTELSYSLVDSQRFFSIVAQGGHNHCPKGLVDVVGHDNG